jgi:hypothetical protein
MYIYWKRPDLQMIAAVKHFVEGLSLEIILT